MHQYRAVQRYGWVGTIHCTLSSRAGLVHDRTMGSGAAGGGGAFGSPLLLLLPPPLRLAAHASAALEQADSTRCETR